MRVSINGSEIVVRADIPSDLDEHELHQFANQIARSVRRELRSQAKPADLDRRVIDQAFEDGIITEDQKNALFDLQRGREGRRGGPPAPR